MPKITLIKPQKNKKRLNIYLDGKFSFGLDLENFVKEKLKVEQELTDEQVLEIVEKAELQKTKDKLIRFATTRPRSKKEVNDWFKRKKVHEGIRERLVRFLQRYDMQDDEKFAKWWVEQRLTFRNRSRRQLVAELRQKGIGKNTIEDVLSDADVDDAKAAKKLLDKNKNRWLKYEGLEKQRKMTEYLARKGFNWEVIKKLVRVDD